MRSVIRAPKGSVINTKKNLIIRQKKNILYEKYFKRFFAINKFNWKVRAIGCALFVCEERVPQPACALLFDPELCPDNIWWPPDTHTHRGQTSATLLAQDVGPPNSTHIYCISLLSRCLVEKEIRFLCKTYSLSPLTSPYVPLLNTETVLNVLRPVVK